MNRKSVLFKFVQGMEMDQNEYEMGTLNQNGQLPVGVTIWYSNVFCESGHDTYAYQMSFMHMHVGGRAWIIFQIKESPGKSFIIYHQYGTGNNCKYLVNLTYRCGDIKYFNSKSAT